jgi:hypothetical protein
MSAIYWFLIYFALLLLGLRWVYNATKQRSAVKDKRYGPGILIEHEEIEKVVKNPLKTGEFEALINRKLILYTEKHFKHLLKQQD